jgi:hypothetical protein
LRLSLKIIVRAAMGDETELALGAGRPIRDYAEVSVELVVVLDDLRNPAEGVVRNPVALLAGGGIWLPPEAPS